MRIKPFKWACSIFFALLITILYFTEMVFCQTWQIQSIDSLTEGISSLKSEITDNGDLFVIYRLDISSKLILLSDTNGVWERDTIQFPTQYENFVVDDSGFIYLVSTSYNFNNQLIVCLTYYRGTAHLDTVFASDGMVVGADIDLDNDGNPHISVNYMNQNGWYVMHCYKDQTGWHPEIVCPINAVNGSTDIEITTGNDVFIASANPDNPGYVSCSTKQSGNWQTEIVYNYHNVNFNSALDLTLNRQNIPSLAFHISFPQTVTGSIVCMNRHDNIWDTMPSVDTSYCNSQA